VVVEADVPPFRFATGKLPVTPPLALDARFAAGISAETRVLNAGVLAPPEVGPQKQVLALSVPSVTAKVPVLVIGLPATLKIPGMVSATLDTPPGGTDQVPSPRQKVVDEALVPLLRFPTGRFPVTPPAVLIARLMDGMSAETRDRNVGAPDTPPDGPEKMVLIAWLVKVPVNVPEDVIGEPEMENIPAGSAKPTLVTFPPPPPLPQRRTNPVVAMRLELSQDGEVGGVGATQFGLPAPHPCAQALPVRSVNANAARSFLIRLCP
jgi:hypothetical protein